MPESQNSFSLFNGLVSFALLCITAFFGWLKTGQVDDRKKADDLEERIEDLERIVSKQETFCAITSANIVKVMERLEKKLDRLIESKSQ